MVSESAAATPNVGQSQHVKDYCWSNLQFSDLPIAVSDARQVGVETRSTRRPFRVANKDDAFGCVGIKISPEIVGVKTKEHAAAGLIADAGNLLFADCTGEENLTGIVSLRGDDDPSRDCESYYSGTLSEHPMRAPNRENDVSAERADNSPRRCCS